MHPRLVGVFRRLDFADVGGGELFAVNEPIINKDMLLLKLDKVQRYAEKQKLVIKDLS